MQRALSSRMALVMMVNVTVTLTSLLTEVGGLSFAAAADDSTVWELKPYRICASWWPTGRPPGRMSNWRSMLVPYNVGARWR